MRHLEVYHLWIQNEALAKRLAFGKVSGTNNPADMLTKSLEACKRQDYVRKLGIRFIEGRAKAAPMLAEGGQHR